MAKVELLAIVGQTAAGKSGLALKVAKQFKGEIISADSWTVYKGFDIGTAKAGQKDQKAVKHHLLSIREAKQGFNAALFKDLAKSAIKDIQSRGKLSILTGGTGLYIDSVLYDFGFLPNSDERAKLDKLPRQELLLLAAQRRVDLTDIDSGNKRRIIRAIEAKGQKPTKAKLRPNSLIIGIKTSQSTLDKQIEKRVDKMIAGGLHGEVKGLSKQYGWDAEPMKGIGYKEWRDYFAGSQSLDQTRQKIIANTRNLAKRQWTWFKRNQDVHWFSSAGQAYSYIHNALNN